VARGDDRRRARAGVASAHGGWVGFVRHERVSAGADHAREEVRIVAKEANKGLEVERFSARGVERGEFGIRREQVGLGDRLPRRGERADHDDEERHLLASLVCWRVGGLPIVAKRLVEDAVELVVVEETVQPLEDLHEAQVGKRFDRLAAFVKVLRARPTER
jgi:hypothetical protein